MVVVVCWQSSLCHEITLQRAKTEIVCHIKYGVLPQTTALNMATFNKIHGTCFSDMCFTCLVASHIKTLINYMAV